MGLRVKVVLWVLSLSAALGGLALWFLHASVEQNHLALEQRAVRADVVRLLQTLDDELVLRDRVLREWSVWPDLYQYAADGNARFAEQNLNAASIGNSGLNWLGLYARDGALRHSIVAPGQATWLDLPADFGPAAQALLARPAVDASMPCGLARARRDLMMVCRRPLLDGLGGAPARGTVAIAEWLSPAVLLAVARRSGLELQLRPLRPGEILPGEPLELDLRSQTGPGPAKLDSTPALLLIYWPLHDLAGVPVAVLETRWPRHILQQGQELLQRVRWVMLGLALALAAGLVWAADRLLVARLVLLRREIADI
ncbi:MAG TPA: CHASE4 domain-containing protein, partial [Roseateles sp.]|nr:CHASE4 domain-containing protein [Roseateles sp.]